MEDAARIFDRPYLEWPDEYDHGEARFIVVGEVSDRVLVVAYTWRQENRRIISARKATKGERQEYYRAIVAI